MKNQILEWNQGRGNDITANNKTATITMSTNRPTLSTAINEINKMQIALGIEINFEGIKIDKGGWGEQSVITFKISF